MGDKILEDCFA